MKRATGLSHYMDFNTTRSCLGSQMVSFLLLFVVLVFYVPPTAKVIWRRDLGLKSHPKDFS